MIALYYTLPLVHVAQILQVDRKCVGHHSLKLMSAWSVYTMIANTTAWGQDVHTAVVRLAVIVHQGSRTPDTRRGNHGAHGGVPNTITCMSWI
jgi:hypothetical protein